MELIELEASSQIQRSIDQSEFMDISTSLRESDSSKDQIQELARSVLKPYPESVRTRVWNEFFALGPLVGLFERTEITEILINGPREIWIEIGGRLEKHTDYFFSDVTYRNFVDRFCALAGVHATHEHPSCDGAFGKFRLSLVRENLTRSYTHLSLRKHPENPWNFQRLAESGWCEERQIPLFQSLIDQQKNFLVIGTTGSGKTSLLNALLSLTRHNERALLIEDSPELEIPNSVSMKLLTREDPQKIQTPITQADLVKRSLRLRPDRIVMGELRGEEAKDFLMCLSTGHRGSFGTLHAQSAHQALLRLEMLIQLGAPQWSLQAIRRLIQLSLDYILITEKTAQGRRRFAGLYRLSSLEEHGFLVEAVQEIKPQLEFL
ncbi:MAG: CpaF family protein [Bdellovibrionaceae bacterium]|nr:CpaF family protein [Pseudobdellovibrionaceae bacterium]